MTCEPAQRAARHRRCAVPHSCVCTAARRRRCGMEGPLTIRSGATPGPGTPCQWKPHAVCAPALTAWSTVVRTVVGATARGRRRRSASGTRPIPSSRRGTCAAGGVATGRPSAPACSSTPTHLSTPAITAETRACVPPKTWAVVQAPGPAWLPIVRETPQRTQAGNEGTCPRVPQKGRHWPAGAPRAM